MSKPSSTSINIPDATTADVAQRTQYGMRHPDGSVKWETLSASAIGHHDGIKITDIVAGAYRADSIWARELKARAEKANVNLYDYSNQHKIVTRTVVLAVAETVDHAADLRPWNVHIPTPPRTSLSVTDTEEL